MLKPNAFANSLAVVSGIIYLVFVILASVSQPVFEFLFNAQFLGADFAPDSLEFNLGVLIAVVIFGWVVGFIWASLYNSFNK